MMLNGAKPALLRRVGIGPVLKQIVALELFRLLAVVDYWAIYRVRVNIEHASLALKISPQ